MKRNSLSLEYEWTRPMEQPQDGINSKTYWRKVDKIIIHNKFINEARSWKGYDFALIKLSPEHGKLRPEKAVMPVCLPATGFESKSNESLFMAGYGRRSIPHCLTNIGGPEKFEVCKANVLMKSIIILKTYKLEILSYPPNIYFIFFIF